VSSGLLEAHGLGHRFEGGRWGLKDVTLAFGPGQFVVVAGPNGAGKTLLMRHLVGLVAPTEGGVSLDGVDIKQHLPEVRRRVGLVFQDSGAQIVGVTVEEEAAFGPRNLGWPRDRVREAVDTSLGIVGLSDRLDALCAHLSGGERRRLAIAGVVACEPDILVLDEPFTGLDLPAIQAVLRCLTDLHARGKTIVLLTHELDKCLALADRLVLVSGGRVYADGTPEGLWDRIPEVNTHRPRGGVERLKEMTWL
jgi:biotin transport system ATP-binding protein